MIEMRKQYTTRDGDPVVLYKIHKKGRYPVHGAIYSPVDDAWYTICWALDGAFHTGMPEHGLSLIEKDADVSRSTHSTERSTGEILSEAHSAIMNALSAMQTAVGSAIDEAMRSETPSEEPAPKPQPITLAGRYQTRSGRKVRIYAVNEGPDLCPVHGAVYFEDDASWSLHSWTLAGKFYAADINTSRLDLVPLEFPRSKIC